MPNFYVDGTMDVFVNGNIERRQYRKVPNYDYDSDGKFKIEPELKPGEHYITNGEGQIVIVQAPDPYER